MASLFDDPDIVRKQQLQQQIQAGGGTPAARLGTNIGYGIGRLFGREMPEVRAAEQKQQIMQDVLDSTDEDGNPYQFGTVEFYDNMSQKLLDGGLIKEAFQVSEIRNKAATTAQAAEDKALDRKLKKSRIKAIDQRTRGGSFSDKLRDKKYEQEKAPTDNQILETQTFLGPKGNASGLTEENQAFLKKSYYGQDEEEQSYVGQFRFGEENIPEETGISMFTDDDGAFTGTSTQSQIEEMVARQVRNRRLAGEEVTQATINEIIDDIRNASSFTEVDPKGFGDKGFYKPNIQSPSKEKSDTEMNQSMQLVGNKFLDLVETEGMSPEEARGVLEDAILDMGYTETQSKQLLEVINTLQDELE
jgi:hypothetical protein